VDSAKFQTLYDNLPDSYIYQCKRLPDGGTRILYVSAGVQRVLGVAPEVALEDAGALLSRIDPGQIAAIAAAEEASARGNSDLVLDLRMRRVDGEWRWLRVHATPQHSKDGGTVWSGIVTDVTSQRSSPADSGEERLRAVLDNMLEGCQIIDFDFRYIYVNASAAVHGRRSATELIGRRMRDVYPEIEETPLFDLLQRCMTERRSFRIENEFNFLDKTFGTFELSIQPVPEGALILSFDVTARKRAEEEAGRLRDRIESQRKRLESIVVNVPGVVWEAWSPAAAGPSQHTGFVSNYVEKLIGYSVQEWLSQPDFWISIIHREDRQQIAEAVAAQLSSGLDNRMKFRWIAKSGRTVWIEAHTAVVMDEHGRIAGMRGVCIDITEPKALEAQFRHAQKMEAIGRLAGGVAHDFNNILTVISGYSDLAIGRIEADNPLRHHFVEIKKAARRAAGLTRQLLTFSRRQNLQPRILCLNSTLSQLESMLRRVIGEDIELNTILAQDLRPVLADVGQVEQVIMNLVVNARDAMPNGGQLTLETANAELGEDYCRTHPDLRPGPYVTLTVSDNGIGIDPETQSSIFEPFFTTKEEGKGTGLGLSTVYGIVTQSGGTVWVYSEPGRGSTFRVYLPAIPEVAKPGESAAKPAGANTGTETIVLAGEDPTLLLLTREILEANGYSVLTADNGAQALSIAERHAGPVHLLITDVFSSGREDIDLATRMTRVRPGVKVLYMSGHTDNSAARQRSLAENMSSLRKPFAASQLLRAVRSILDAPKDA
jgi:two-component system, cell cycle sensor histidine kinase and response regulator CckA